MPIKIFPICLAAFLCQQLDSSRSQKVQLSLFPLRWRERRL